MKTWEPLRGHGSIDRVYAQGRRLDSGPVRCFVHVDPAGPRAVRVTFSASSRTFTAVQRNRAKRLMREAFRRVWAGVQQLAAASGATLSMVFLYRGRKGLPFRPTLEDVHGGIASVCASLRAQL